MTKETAGLARFVFSVSALALGTTLTNTDFAAADEGGVGFWVTGFASSLAATAQVPGFHSRTFFITLSLQVEETSLSPVR